MFREGLRGFEEGWVGRTDELVWCDGEFVRDQVACVVSLGAVVEAAVLDGTGGRWAGVGVCTVD